MTTGPTPAAVAPPAPSIRPVMVASFIGTAIEWYDFFLYGTAAALVFGRLFFPNADPLVGTLSAFGTFAVGFVARPLGGVVFGHYGDRVGRKAMLIYSLVIMGVATFLIGLLPTYETIGVWAPVLLVVAAVPAGHRRRRRMGRRRADGRRALAGRPARTLGRWPQMGVPAGLFLSTVVFGLVSSALGEEEFLRWGWRLPFLLSAVLIGGRSVRAAAADGDAGLRATAGQRQTGERGRSSPPSATTAATCCSRWACASRRTGCSTSTRCSC